MYVTNCPCTIPDLDCWMAGRTAATFVDDRRRVCFPELFDIEFHRAVVAFLSLLVFLA